MTERVVNTYNVFVDSSTGRDNNSKGDNYHLHLGNAGINCDAGQYLRLNLNQFTMHKNFTDVNAESPESLLHHFVSLSHSILFSFEFHFSASFCQCFAERCAFSSCSLRLLTSFCSSATRSSYGCLQGSACDAPSRSRAMKQVGCSKAGKGKARLAHRNRVVVVVSCRCLALAAAA